MLKGVHKTRKRLADGSIREYYYAWKGGPRLNGKPGSPEFVASYQEAVKGRHVPLKDSFGYIITKYKEGPLNGLRPATRRDYQMSLKDIEQAFHDMPLPEIEKDYLVMRRAFNSWRDSLDLSPRAADKRWVMLSTLCTFAVKQGIMSRNPCQYGGTKWRGTRRDIIWTEHQISRFCAFASDKIRLVFDLALETGQRQSDLLALKWFQFDGQRLCLQQSKRGHRVSILLSRELAARLRRLPKETLTICANSHGKPWTSNGFRVSFNRQRIAAGIEGVNFHDLRGTAVVRAAKDGADEYELSSRFGWSLTQVRRILSAHYLAPDQQKADAIVLRAEAKARTKLQTVSKPHKNER